MTIAEISDLKPEWIALVDDASDLSINGGDVQRADCAGMQLLLTVVKAIRAKDGLVTWSEAADPVNNVAAILGMTSLLGLK